MKLPTNREEMLKAFCPTGEGGGIDNSCPPGSEGDKKANEIARGVVDRSLLKDWKPRNWGGMQKPARYVMDYRRVNAMNSPDDLKKVYASWANLSKNEPLGYIRYDDIIRHSKLSPVTVMRVIKFHAEQDRGNNLTFGVDRMGANAHFKFKKPL